MVPFADRTRALLALGRRVRSRRHDLGLTQQALADRIGVQRAYLGHVENGQRNVSLHNLLRIAAALNLDASDLVAGLLSATP